MPRSSLLALAILLTAAPARCEAKPPNILFILIDDLGWMDLACQGNKLVETPNIDRLAKQGMRFTDAYAAAPVCSPTRGAILTGQSPARLQITNHIPDRPQFTPKNARLLPAKMLNYLPLRHMTIAEHLRKVGYRTGFFGKWHLSGRGRGKPKWAPEQQGFDINVGGCGYGGPPTFFDPYRIPTIENRKKGEYLPERLADEAIKFMRAKDKRPFMLFLWNYTVHWPMEAPDEMLKKYEKYRGKRGGGLNDYRYGAMIEAMDKAVGRVIDELNHLGIAKNTLVIFNSDNGGFAGVSDNRPLRAAKGHLYEGGIRVPLIVRWPGQIQPGSTCREPVISMDFYPTLQRVAGIPAQQVQHADGADLLPLFRQTGKLSRPAIFFHYPNYAWHRSNRLGSALRSGAFKCIERFDTGEIELYNLKKDLGERQNIAAQHPQMVRSFRFLLKDWRQQTGAAMPVKK